MILLLLSMLITQVWLLDTTLNMTHLSSRMYSLVCKGEFTRFCLANALALIHKISDGLLRIWDMFQ